MEYAIGIYFDEDSTNKLSEISNAIANKTGNRFLIDSKFKPHITLAIFQTGNIAPIETALGGYVKKRHKENIIWPSLGAFPPTSLFAAPLFTDYLRALNFEINELVKDLSVPGENNFYLPNRWVPHTALAVRLTKEELLVAFETAVSMYSHITGKSEKLFLGPVDSSDDIVVYDFE
jgi:2'-5' RNA ligase